MKTIAILILTVLSFSVLAQNSANLNDKVEIFSNGDE
jgi:hypothetical protein